MIGVAPRLDRYFSDGWNTFDLLVIVFLIVSLMAFTAAAPSALILLIVRLLRLLQRFSAVQAMHLIISTLFRSIPRMAHVIILLGIVVHMYAISRRSFFGDHDPEHWGTFGVSVLSLFQIVTLDGWAEIMQPALEYSPYAWVYFVSYLVVATFIGANLFVAVVVSSMDEAKRATNATPDAPSSNDEVMRATSYPAIPQTIGRIAPTRSVRRNLTAIYVNGLPAYPTAFVGT